MEVLHQEGHSKPVYDVAFHPDGSVGRVPGVGCEEEGVRMPLCDVTPLDE